VPVSSSAHLVLVPYVLGWSDNLGTDVGFDIAVHLGTLVAVLVYFGPDLWAILPGTFRAALRRAPSEEDRTSARLAGMLTLGSVPAVVIGLTLEGPVSEVFDHPPTVAALLLVTAALLLGADLLYRRRPEGRRELAGVSWGDALVIGALQAVAVLPGVSRSGSTIAAGMARGLTREASARFSFLLGLPAILGAAVLLLPDIEAGIPVSWILWSSVVAALTGLAAIAFLIRYLKTRPLRPFAYYCVAASAVALAVWIAR
jgi:undecaprenyl-diphosphatase